MIGMMGAGKSAVALRTASILAMVYVDIDNEVAARVGCSISELWGSQGEEAFRDMEAVQVAEASRTGGLVVATGGGVVLRQANIDAMRASGKVIWLQAGAETLTARVRQGRGRPLLEGGDVPLRIEEILSERSELYATAADWTVATDGMSIDEVAQRVVSLWNAS